MNEYNLKNSIYVCRTLQSPVSTHTKFNGILLAVFLKQYFIAIFHFLFSDKIQHESDEIIIIRKYRENVRKNADDAPSWQAADGAVTDERQTGPAMCGGFQTGTVFIRQTRSVA